MKKYHSSFSTHFHAWNRLSHSIDHESLHTLHIYCTYIRVPSFWILCKVQFNYSIVARFVNLPLFAHGFRLVVSSPAPFSSFSRRRQTHSYPRWPREKPSLQQSSTTFRFSIANCLARVLSEATYRIPTHPILHAVTSASGLSCFNLFLSSPAHNRARLSSTRNFRSFPFSPFFFLLSLSLSLSLSFPLPKIPWRAGAPLWLRSLKKLKVSIVRNAVSVRADGRATPGVLGLLIRN